MKPEWEMDRFSASAIAALAIAAFALSACSSDRHAARSPGKASPPAAAAGPLGARQAEYVWHLRSGLNVAALNCRGRGNANVASGYNRMLSRHRSILADAARQEQARHPGRAYDSHITSVYNRHALIRNHRHYCAEAQAIVGRINTASSAELARMAPAALDQLDAARKRR
jgi:hypothetical protein